MNLITVQSSNISQIGFEENQSITLNQKPRNVLRVVFANGLIYDYYGVDKNTFDDFLNSESKGKFLHSNIAKQYPYEKI